MFHTQDPFTGSQRGPFAYRNLSEIHETLDLMSKAQKLWARSALAERKSALEGLARTMSGVRELLVEAIHKDMGKSLAEAKAEIEKSIFAIQWSAENLDRLSFGEFTKGSRSQVAASFDGTPGSVALRPLGNVLAIMPWNFPVWQVVRALVPAVAAGNGFLLKPSEVAFETNQILKVLFERNLPRDLVNVAFIAIPDIEKVIADPRVHLVTLTGSARAGRLVAEACGRYLKKVILELGGSDPYLVFEDADLLKSARSCAQSRMINGGQSCIAAKRFLVSEKVYDSWMRAFQAELSKFAETSVPLAQPRFADQIEDQVKTLLHEGGKLVASFGKRELGFYPIQVIECQGTEPSLRQTEFFGPVAVVMKFRSEEEAIEKANSTEFGLGAAVFTASVERAEMLSREITAGLFAWNDFNRSDVRLPFGGTKTSGFGREMGPFSLLEMSNLQAHTGF